MKEIDKGYYPDGWLEPVPDPGPLRREGGRERWPNGGGDYYLSGR